MVLGHCIASETGFVLSGSLIPRRGDCSHRALPSETEALVGSFAGEPELHHPIRGRVKGRRGFERFVAEINAWLEEHEADAGPVQRIITPHRGIEETVLSLETEQGRLDWPMAVAADRGDDGRIIELRPRPGSRSTSAARAAGCPPRASTTTSHRRCREVLARRASTSR
jgi:hypothetical protein